MRPHFPPLIVNPLLLRISFLLPWNKCRIKNTRIYFLNLAFLQSHFKSLLERLHYWPCLILIYFLSIRQRIQPLTLAISKSKPLPLPPWWTIPHYSQMRTVFTVKSISQMHISRVKTNMVSSSLELKISSPSTVNSPLISKRIIQSELWVTKKKASKTNWTKKTRIRILNIIPNRFEAILTRVRSMYTLKHYLKISSISPKKRKRSIKFNNSNRFSSLRNKQLRLILVLNLRKRHKNLNSL